MKIEIEGSREDVLDILKAIAGIPETIISGTPIVSIPEVENTPAPENAEGGGNSISIEKIPELKKKRKGPIIVNETGGGLKKAIDLFVGAEGKGFSLQESFDSISAVARFVGAKHPANISAYIDSGKVYKEKYKFISRKM